MSVAFITANALALLASWLLARVLLPATMRDARWFATLAGFPIVVLPTATLLGMLGWLNPAATLTALGVETLLLLGLLRRSQRGASEPAAAPQPPPTGARRPVVDVVDVVDAALTGAALAFVAIRESSIVGRMLGRAMKLGADDFIYHAPMAAHWVQQGRLLLAPSNYHAYYPGNAELFAAWFMLPTRVDSFASLAGAYWLLLCAGSVAMIARQCSGRTVAALWGALALLSCAPFAQYARTFAAVDVAGTALAAAATAIALADTGRESRGVRLAIAFYAGMLVGLAAGVKVTFAPAAVPLLLWLLWPSRAERKAAVHTLAVFAASAFLGCGYWYLRNWVVTGNPLFPADVLIFDGPLDAESRARTTLVYALTRLRAAEIDRAIAELLDWPATMVPFIAAGYVLTALSMCWPRSWRNESSLRLCFCFVMGLLLVFAIAAGPFSGTQNAPGGDLMVRLRFLLPWALFGVAMTAAWLGRAGIASAGLSVAAGALLLKLGGTEWADIAAIGAAGGLAGAALVACRREFERLPAGLQRGIGGGAVLAALVALCASANHAIAQRHDMDSALRRKIVPAWNVLDKLPKGSRVAWFSTYAGPYTYRAFGDRLTRVPVEVQKDGARLPLLHEYWRRYRPTWWKLGKPPSRTERLIENLRAQRVDYVLVLRKRKDEWPQQYPLLRESKRVTRLIHKRDFELFKIEASQK